MILVYVVVAAIVVLLFVTRLAGRRDAVRKAELARQAQALAEASRPNDGGSGDGTA